MQTNKINPGRTRRAAYKLGSDYRIAGKDLQAFVEARRVRSGGA